jgi:hypothetical protein
MWKMPNLRDDHLPPIGHLTPVYPIFKKLKPAAKKCQSDIFCLAIKPKVLAFS